MTVQWLLQDPHLQKRLQQVLKLNKEKWEEARDHAFKAVVVDNRMRVWWASTANPTSRIGKTELFDWLTSSLHTCPVSGTLSILHFNL